LPGAINQAPRNLRQYWES